MLLTDSYGIVPGLTTSRETYESEFRWGSQFQGVFANALISGSAIDTGNTPTFELRPGLLLGQSLLTGKYSQYNPVATDGTEVASAVLIEGLRMLDFSNNAVDRFYAVLVGGPVQSSKLLNLDLQAQQQMTKFIFDTSLNLAAMPGGQWFPFKRFQNKLANYTILATDNYSLFDNTNATGEVDLTLPPIANGYYFAIRCVAAQVFKFISNEGGNIVGSSATQSQVSVTATGGGIGVYSNPAGTKWYVENLSSYNQVVTFA
jgi:hypothetical protein